MRPSYLYPQHPHHYHHHQQQQQQQQQQPAHQITRPNPAPNGHMNPATQRIGLEGLGARPGSVGAPSGLIDLSCSGLRFQHHYQMAPSASDVSGKAYPTPERDARCQSVLGPRATVQRDGVSDLRLMIHSSTTDDAHQVNSVELHLIC